MWGRTGRGGWRGEMLGGSWEEWRKRGGVRGTGKKNCGQEEKTKTKEVEDFQIC